LVTSFRVVTAGIRQPSLHRNDTVLPAREPSRSGRFRDRKLHAKKGAGAYDVGTSSGGV
jgi:hypothetical protein